MPETVTQNGTEQQSIAVLNGHASVPNHGPAFTTERMKELVAALEEPFDPTEIRWRVTNTTQIGSRNGPRFRGQMLAYADPRAYTDRLNELFTPAGWTRDYAVQLVQNFERKERGSAERTITAKIVVTCKVTIHGFGAHTVSEKSGPTTITRVRPPKPRRSNERVHASVWAAICMTWRDNGWIWMRRSALSNPRASRNGRCRNRDPVTNSERRTSQMAMVSLTVMKMARGEMAWWSVSRRVVGAGQVSL